MVDDFLLNQNGKKEKNGKKRIKTAGNEWMKKGKKNVNSFYTDGSTVISGEFQSRRTDG